MYLLQEREVWVLKMSRNQETTTWPHWLSLLLEQTVWCCSYAGHKSLQNLNRGCKVLQNPSKATAVTRNPPFSLFVIVSVRCTVFGSTELHWTPKKSFKCKPFLCIISRWLFFVLHGPSLKCERRTDLSSRQEALGNPGMLLQASVPGHGGSMACPIPSSRRGLKEQT